MRRLGLPAPGAPALAQRVPLITFIWWCAQPCSSNPDGAVGVGIFLANIITIGQDEQHAARAWKFKCLHG